MKNREIYYITYYFPPIHSVAVERNYHLATAIADEADSTTILTTSNRRIFPPDHKPTQKFKVKELITFDYRTIFGLLKPKRQTIHFAEGTKRHSLVRYFIRVNESFPFNIPFGEGGLIYILHGSAYLLKQISGSKKQIVVVSSFRPMSNIIIGYFIKLIYPGIKWVVSFHDVPVQQIRHNVLLPRLQNWYWKIMCQKADNIIGVSDGVAEAISNFGKKAEVISNGVTIRNPISAANNKFLIAFTGSLYNDLIVPDFFFKAIAELAGKDAQIKEDIVIKYAGKDGILWQQSSKPFSKDLPHLDIKGIVSNAEAKAIQEQSNINLMLTWSEEGSKGTLTGKFYEYLGARNPILVLVKGAKDNNLENIINTLACGKLIYESHPNAVSETVLHINELYQSWKTNNFRQKLTQVSSLKDLTWEDKGKQFWDIVNI